MTGKITGALREQSDWAQQDGHRLGFIKNKPFYDTRKAEEIRIPLRFSEEKIELNSKEEIEKLSDVVPTLEELNNAVISVPEGELPISALGGFVYEELNGTKMYSLAAEDFKFFVFIESPYLAPGFYIS